jgi:hypothetical protein
MKPPRENGSFGSEQRCVIGANVLILRDCSRKP